MKRLVPVALFLLAASVSADEFPLRIETDPPAFDHMLQAAVDEDMIVLIADRESCLVTVTRAFATRPVSFSAVCDQDGSVRISVGGEYGAGRIYATQWAGSIRHRAAAVVE